MLLGVYYGIVNTTQYILKIDSRDGTAYGTYSIGLQTIDFAGVVEDNKLSGMGMDMCRTRLYGTLHEQPTRCELKTVSSCNNATQIIELQGFSDQERRIKNIHLLEYALYCIILCLIASFFQYRAMSELRAEKIVEMTLQVNLIFDVVSFYLLLAIDAVYVDTLSAMVFYWGVNLFFATRLVVYLDKKWFTCAFWGSMLFIIIKVQPTLGFIIIASLILSWCRQIWFCFQQGVTPGFTFPYLLSNIIRLFPALYIWGCPVNLVNFGYHHNQGYILLAMVVVLTAIIVCQYFSPRFYLDQIPLLNKHLNVYLKPTHQYVSDLREDDDECCGICLEEFDANHGLLNRIMRAPCDHVFHEQCLEEWLQIKLQCPVCRVELPAI